MDVDFERVKRDTCTSLFGHDHAVSSDTICTFMLSFVQFNQFNKLVSSTHVHFCERERFLKSLKFG